MMRRTKYWFVYLFLAALILCFTACQGMGQSTRDGLKLDIAYTPPVELKLQPYNGGFFSIDLPKGWVIQTVGQFESFGFRAWDPEQPARQLFFYGSMRYFMKSQAGREVWQYYTTYGGYSNAQVYADAPILSPATTEQFFYTFGEFAAYAQAYGIVHDFPVFDELNIIEIVPRNSAISSICLDDSIVRTQYKTGSVPCQGLFAAGISDTMSYYANGVDAGYYTAYAVSGLGAPMDEFPQLQETLSQSLASFRYSEEYIRQGVQNIEAGTEAALAAGRTLSQASDSYNQAFHSRNRVKDTNMQKWSDGQLGYDRVYDTETGEVYRAELGFYEDYDIHREEYANPNLERVPDNGYDLYDQSISGYISKPR